MGETGNNNENVNRGRALGAVRDACMNILKTRKSHYDDEVGDDVYDNMAEVETILLCSKASRAAIRRLPVAESACDSDDPSEGFRNKVMRELDGWAKRHIKGAKETPKPVRKAELPHWTPVTEGLPNDREEVWVTVKRGDALLELSTADLSAEEAEAYAKERWTIRAYRCAEEDEWYDTLNLPLIFDPVAWMPSYVPEPWQGDIPAV